MGRGGDEPYRRDQVSAAGFRVIPDPFTLFLLALPIPGTANCFLGFAFSWASEASETLAFGRNFLSILVVGFEVRIFFIPFVAGVGKNRALGVSFS